MCEYKKIQDKIENLDERNKKEHQEIKKFISEMGKELSKVIKETAVNSEKVQNAKDANKNLRWFIAVIITLGIAFMGWKQAESTSYQKENMEINRIAANARVRAFQLVDSISHSLKRRNWQIKTLQDTVNHIRYDIDSFYHYQWKSETRYTHAKYQKEIHPTYLRALRNEKTLENHEKRLTKLESIIK